MDSFQIICVFPSGRIIDRTLIDERKIAAFADEFPTIVYMVV